MTASPSTGTSRNRPGLVWPLILIYAGVLLLLGNLGYLRADWWELWRLWPLILVLIGLDILSRHSRWASLAVVLVTLAALGGLTYFLITNPGAPLLLGQPTEGGSIPVHQDLGGASRVTVRLNMGAGSLHLGALSAGSESVVEGTLRYGAGWRETPSLQYRLHGEQGDLLVQSGSRGWIGPFWGSQGGEEWDLQLTPSVPLQIVLNAGTSASELDLRNLRVEDLRVAGGVGRLKVYFPAEGGAMSVRIQGGVGESELVIPESVQARIRVEGGIGRVDVASRFAPKGEGVYETEGYARATTRLDIEVEGGVGSVRVY